MTPSPTPQDEKELEALILKQLHSGLRPEDMLDVIMKAIKIYGDQRAQKAHEDGYREGELSGAKGLHDYVFSHFELLPKINNPKVGRGTTHSTVFTEGNYQHVACQYIDMLEAELNAKRGKDNG